ncbi:acyl CoA:acetate/3-ketoacid CoA transferase [Shouchella shacheensis]|uniref:acyl CoA:acetate/3-ketoacid CoA transferase n=1 Tax=Shouchella shacheensis TaxID=1649580 RepID=UPI0007401E68|nr:CoA-transferase [Shouchella shacheensis]
MLEKRIKAEAFAELIEDHTTLAVCGFTLMGACEDILKAIESRYKETKKPEQLTLVHAAGHSNRKHGIEHLAHKGLVGRIIGAHWGLAPKWSNLISTNEVEAHCLSQGQLTHLFRDMAGGKPGTYSKVGLGTFLDPRLEGGCVNEKAQEKESFVELIQIKEEEYLFYNQIPIDVCILRGTTADEFGNITMEDEALKLETLSIAQATKRFGGKVAVQVKNFVKRGTLPARQVVIPGTCVDYIVVTEDAESNHRQTSGSFYNPSYTGDVKEPSIRMEEQPFNARKVIGRRAIQELFDGAVVNLGTGIPGDTVGPVCDEEGVLENIHLTVESGVIGGVPLGGVDFGIARSPDAILDHPSQFDYYIGRGVDVTFMGGAEFDHQGNVNVSKFGPVTTGCGGFIDITQNAHKVVFCSTFTASGLKVSYDNKELKIDQEGKVQKFVDQVQQVTFSGEYAKKKNQDVVLVTERAVFQLTKEGLLLTEIAPGMDIETDIVAHMGFRPNISEGLKQMDQRLFHPEPMGLKKEILANTL